MTTITVDTANEVLVLGFVDDHNNTTNAPVDSTGAPAVLTGTSDTPTVATVGTFALAADGTYQAPITPAGLPGGVVLGATVQDSTGTDVPLPAPVVLIAAPPGVRDTSNTLAPNPAAIT